MVLPSCTRCGKRDPQRMHGLMSLWFGPLVELEADLGYFYLCPACHDELIVPELERIQNRILELHPAAQRHFDEMPDAPLDEAPEDDPGTGGDAGAEGVAANGAGAAPEDAAPEDATPEDATPPDEDATRKDDPSP